MLSFDAIYMGDGNEYQFRLLLRDDKNHTFFDVIEQAFYPRKCYLVVDVNTHESVNAWSQAMPMGNLT